MDKIIKVLLVEDDAISQMAARFSLQAAKCSVDVASSGKQALEKAFANQYDLIFMDIGLEENFDGFTVTEKIRGQAGLNQQTVIIALTANDNQNYRSKAKAVGMNKFMSKPLEVQQIKNIIMHFFLQNE